MEPEQSTVTNTPTPSRTIRVSHEGDYFVSTNHGVTQAENGRRFLTFSSVDDAIQAYAELKTANVRASYLTYSLFVKSQVELTELNLRAQVLALVPDANLTYLRVDDNLHTGKVVVDFLTDYQTLKAGSNDNFRFFHFDPKRVRPKRSLENNQDGQSNVREWKVQERRHHDSGARQHDSSPRQRDSGARQHDSAPRQHDSAPRQRESGPRQHESGPRQRDSGPRQRDSGRGAQSGRGSQSGRRPQDSRGGNNTNAV